MKGIVVGSFRRRSGDGCCFVRRFGKLPSKGREAGWGGASGYVWILGAWAQHYHRTTSVWNGVVSPDIIGFSVLGPSIIMVQQAFETSYRCSG